MSTKENLINDIRPTLTTKIKAFLAVQSPEEEAHQSKIVAVEKQISESTIDESTAALKAVAEKLKASPPKGASKVRAQEAAVALICIANELGLPVVLKTEGKASAAPKAAAKDEQKRSPKAEVGRVAGLILTALNNRGGSAKVAELFADVQGDEKVFKSGLAKLSREKKAASTGEKGRNGGTWKVL